MAEAASFDKFRRDVRGFGPPDARIVIVGEAPGAEELARGVPFVGPSGRELRRRLLEHGIDPEKVRYENVIERKLDGNDVSPLYEDAAHEFPGPELRAWRIDLRERLRRVSPKVVIAAGETAMLATCDLSAVPRPTISSVQSMVLNAVLPIPAGTPVVPVYHPAAIFRMPQFGPWLNFGLAKARRLAAGERRVEPSLLVMPTLAEIVEFFGRANLADAVSCDLEIFGNEISCIGFATSSQAAISIPFAKGPASYWTPDDELVVWGLIDALMRNAKVDKIFQNCIFDIMYLSRHGIETSGRVFDTMLAASVLHAELPKGLDDLARLYTLASPWKGITSWFANVSPDALAKYNATDAVITYEVMEAQRDELKERGLSNFFERHVVELVPHVYAMCARGWHVDQAALGVIAHDMDLEISKLAAKISEIAGVEFNPRSPSQVKEFLFAHGIPVPTKDGRETTDRKALLKVSKRYDAPIVAPLMEFSKAAKLKSTYCDVALDHDSRLRFSVNVGGTKSGRFSSSQTPWKSGLNSQNIPSRDPSSPYNFRQIVLPDPGRRLLQVDLAQAEARVVAWLAREETMSRIFETGGDIHTKTASLIFGTDITKIDDLAERKRRRYLGKKSVHAFNYGMAEATFVDSCLLESGIVIPMDEAVRLKAAYFRGFPRILEWHRQVQAELRKTRTLTTPFGRTRAFHGRLDDETFREAYSFIPQAVVADYLNEAWLFLEEARRESILYDAKANTSVFDILQQGHDSLLIQYVESSEPLVIKTVQTAFSSVAFELNGASRRIPYDIATGPNWRDLREIPRAA